MSTIPVRQTCLSASAGQDCKDQLADSTVCAKLQNELDCADFPKIHVLAVDDSLLERKVIERLLKTSSYEVTTVDSASRALEILGVADGILPLVPNAIKINLIITDYCMPGMSGYDLLKRVKQISSLKEIPVVIMSSENVPNRVKRCLAEGAKEFIIKPVRMADVKRLECHVRKRKLFNTNGSGSTPPDKLYTSNESGCTPSEKLSNGFGSTPCNEFQAKETSNESNEIPENSIKRKACSIDLQTEYNSERRLRLQSSVDIIVAQDLGSDTEALAKL
ncbi:hypothetical protein O6H91_06G098600 [Diphasiastrum complanatum]|uniref:Uncharacterized protein n=1 Tax=Diphasiastrum complanatum TaxID=34168 RepID=A0ACC2DGP0_DIPCM|nr:hypothetical protein O6H91_06G098600 [Diphasiastrum complanatum]